MCWTPPNKGWFKVNFDGVAQACRNVVGEGFVIRNDSGDLIMCGAKRLRSCTNNEAEAQATLLVVRLARNQGVRNLHLEGAP